MDNCTYIKKEVKYPHEEVEANRSDGTTPVINQTFIEDPKEQDYHIKIEEIDIKFEYDCSRLEDYQNSLNNGNESFETPSLNHLHQNITSSNTSSRGASTTEQHSDDCSNRSEVELKTRNTEKKQTWTEWFNCDSCDFKAKQKCYLKCHKLGHKPPSKNEWFSCVLCNSKVKHRESFNKRRSAHERNWLKCDLCSFRTLWRDRLKKHMPVHKQSLVDGHSDRLKTKVKGHVSVHKESSVDEHSDQLKTKVKGHVSVHKESSVDEHSERLKIKVERHMSVHKESSFNEHSERLKTKVERHMSIHKESSFDEHSDELKTKVERHMSVHKESSFDEHSDELKTKVKIGHVSVHKESSSFDEHSAQPKTKVKSHIDKDESRTEGFNCDSCDFKAKQNCDLKSHKLVHKPPSKIEWFRSGAFCALLTPNIEGTSRNIGLLTKEKERKKKINVD